ncbi:amidase [Sulfobacillus acidophilus TPY]|uniref:Amidase n=1 Tax=Sulfobacillus acidophilus (strain ATCC 700253 / DSM 10332 / NAL) TaxID=679936 RepID=G8TS75_SULAD|nr:amidase [Sulfobacillus acidophilus TPY]AEW05487.1 Amidase [Sulfobacillus acidophilus DSM 10332]
MTIRELTTRFRQGDLSPVEWTRTVLAALPAWQQRTGLMVSWDEERALSEARAAEARYRQGNPRGPLDGVLVGLKDLIDRQGQVTTAGSLWHSATPATEDAQVTRQLRQAGAHVDLGKLNLHEYAYGPTSTSSAFGPVRNPWNSQWMAGGSSGGSAVAVASGLMAGAVGTDTGGSIRIPAAFCHVVGLKPSMGRVSTDGVIPLAWSLDHVGPLARTVEDVALLWDVLAGPATASEPIRTPVRIYWPEGPSVDPDEEDVAHVLRQTVQRLADATGAVVERGPLPHVEEIRTAQSIILSVEALTYHWPKWLEAPERYQPDVRDRLAAGGDWSAVEYVQAKRYQNWVKAWYANWWSAYDVIVLATVPVAPPPLTETHLTTRRGREDVRAVVTRLTNPFNLLGLPAIAVPAGWTSDGRPVSLQLVAAYGQERALLEIAAIYEAATGWVHETPPGALSLT